MEPRDLGNREKIGSRVVAWNPHKTDQHGVICAMVTENQAGYVMMSGQGRGSTPWYLASLDNHRDENGKVNYKTLWENAETTARSINKMYGYTEEEVSDVIHSAMTAQSEKLGEESFFPRTDFE
jgi:hypothetical protein